MAKGKEKSAAVVTIFDAPNMTAKGKHAIALWLRRQARQLERDAKLYAKRFTARYLYR